jgi:DEAD/DEAH box helicase domain-containing protein
VSLKDILRTWQIDPTFQECVSTWQHLPAQKAEFVPFPDDVLPAILNKLESLNIHNLYAHQLRAWHAANTQQNVVLTTGTASGKTLAYNLPILNKLLTNYESRALYLFPTKALSQDQNNNLLDYLPLQSGTANEQILLSKADIGVYDGDTSSSKRKLIRQHARILITNPDMLHIGILPHHTRWADFFRGLQFIVLDEVHTYRGVFGSHLANVIRRLKRIAEFYGSRPTFLCTSATIANPRELCEWLTGESVEVISEDASAKGGKEFISYNPPVIDPELGLRRGVLQECALLSQVLYASNVQTLIFARSRRSVELLLRNLREQISSSVPAEIRGYRSGYLPPERREIEHSLRSGDARLIIATNALELGVDIGGLDAVILAGYPGKISSTWQQAGRSGRMGNSMALVVLIFGPNPLDQFLAHHPEYFFGKSPEKALLNPDHLMILFDHIKCAAYELPFSHGDKYGSLSTDELEELLEIFSAEQLIHPVGQKYMWISDSFPAAEMSLRNASAERILIQNNGQTIGETDQVSAYWLLHPEAVYLHEGQSFFVQNLDLDQKIASVTEIEADYYTEPKIDTTVSVIEEHEHTKVPGAQKYYGDLQVTRAVTGYKKIQWGTYTNLGNGLVQLPPVEFFTSGYWLVLSESTISLLRAEGFWRNDANQYGSKWEHIRSLVRARDEYRCQVCGTPETGPAHHVHHKIPFRSFASPIEANRLDNLVTLCPTCHRRVEQNVRIRSGLAGLGYILANLAPLFLMCDQSNLGLYADARSTVAEGAPAIVIYETIPAGIGLCRELYSISDELIVHAQDLVKSCQCLDGCPSCVGPGGENGLGSKQETLALLEALCSPAEQM